MQLNVQALATIFYLFFRYLFSALFVGGGAVWLSR
jgi:hypothetical protein